MESRCLASDHFESDGDVAARGVRIRADLFVRFPHQCGKLGLLDALVLDEHLHREAEAAAVARADRHSAGDLRPGGITLFLFRHEIERTAEAGGIARGEEMLRRCKPRLAGATQLPGYREVRLDDSIAGLRMAVAPANGGCGCGKERLDLVHVSFL